jgi:hypothetical protein
VIGTDRQEVLVSGWSWAWSGLAGHCETGRNTVASAGWYSEGEAPPSGILSGSSAINRP